MHPSNPKSKRSRKHVRPGAAPGTLVGDPRAEKSRIRVLAFGPDRCEEREVTDILDLRQLLEAWPTVWVDVAGVGDVQTVARLGELLQLHRLALEDVVNVGQRTKLDPYDEHLFLVTRVYDAANGHDSQQLSLFLGERFVVTFREHAPDPFEPIRTRVREGKGRIRTSGPSYLVYALLDAVVDLHYPALYRLGDEIEALETEVLGRWSETTIHRLHSVRSRLRGFRRELVPQRDLLHTLLQEELPCMSRSVHVYLRDCHDHANQLVDLVEQYREVSSDLVAACLSQASQGVNATMRVLTVISTIFIPLGVLASVYGMNFDPTTSPWNMPELRWRFGYPAVLAGMLVVAGAMLVWFRRAGWIGANGDARTPAPAERS